MATIKKKVWPDSFELVKSGEKKKEYTGRKIEKIVSYVYKFELDKYGQKKEIEEKEIYVIQF